MDNASKNILDILNYITEKVFIVTFEGNIVYVNKAACEQLGCLPKEILQKNIQEINIPSYIQLIPERIAQVKKLGMVVFESEHVKKDKSIIPVEVSFHLIEYDGISCVCIVARDAAQKQIHKRLRENEEKWRAIAENISDIVWIVNLQFEPLFVNSAVERVLGFTLDEYLQRKVEDKYPKELLQKMYLMLLEEMENDTKPGVDKNRTRIIEIQEYRKDGSLADLSVHVNFLRDEIGKPYAIIGISRDITEQKKVLKEIQRYKLIFEQSLNEIYIFDAKTLRFTFVNQGGINNLGYSMQELKDMTPVDIAPEFTLQQLEALLQPLRQGTEKSMVFETVHRRKDGTHYDAEVHLQFMNVEGEEFFTAIIIDITQRKKFEEQLNESEEKFRILAKSTPIVIMMYQDDKWIYANPAAEILLGYSEQELCTMNFWDVVHPDDKAIIIERGKKRQKGEDAEVGYEFRVIDKSGTVKWVLLYGATVMYRGKTAGLIFVMDITERKKIDEEKRKLHEELLHSQKMESIGTLASGVAHEFNNMLNIISGHAELALLNIQSDNPARTDIEEIKKAAQRSAEITKKLLTFARKQEEKHSLVNVNTAIDSMIGMLKRLIGENIQLVWKPVKKELSVQINEVSFDQILVNLCVNSRDAIKDHGVITITTDSVIIDDKEALQRNVLPGEYALIEVADNGIGMNKETLEHIFDPFFTTKGVGKGTGLGLSTVYGIIKNNGGCIDVQSEIEKGSAFKIYIPLFIEKRDYAQYHDDAVQKLFRGTETILLVEDEVSILKMMKRMLGILGYTVLEASDPFEALEIVKSYIGTIHLLITDVIMPKMNGVDLSKLVSAIYPQIKIIYTSGYSSDVLLKHSIKISDINYLKKPVSFATLASTVRTVLDN